MMRTTGTISRRGRGMTLLEMMLAITITTVLSTAIAGLLTTTMKANTYFNAQGTAISEVDLALARIVYNTRTAGAVPTWGTVGGFSTLSITKTSVGTVTYYVDGSGNLVESDPRYNSGSTPNVLVHGIGSSGFSCTITAPSGTQTNTLVKVNIVMGASQVVERHVSVMVRGF